MGEHVEDPRFAAFYGLLVVEWRLGERLDTELQANAGVSDSDSRPAVAVISEKSGTNRPLRSTLGL